MSDIPEITKFEIAKLELKPGDILCFRFPEEYSQFDAIQFRNDIVNSGFMPDDIGVLFLQDDVEITIIDNGKK